ncbi:hypothetical protein A9Q87_09560 [Flavobacteriales bacterium 34_180_T64]|nr:hypothetical protein A9Q87_09560 [Flavobacteriales bacterium 34_180_T64]
MKIKSLTSVIVLFLFSLSTLAQEGKVTIDQDSDISTLLEYKKDLKTVELYRIQVYSGDRKGAEKTEREFKFKYGDWTVDKVFETPKYKIWVGNFRSRLEADKALLKIKKNYTHAFIFTPKRDKKK